MQEHPVALSDHFPDIEAKVWEVIGEGFEEVPDPSRPGGTPRVRCCSLSSDTSSSRMSQFPWLSPSNKCLTIALFPPAPRSLY
jgi:hypothetical protein